MALCVNLGAVDNVAKKSKAKVASDGDVVQEEITYPSVKKADKRGKTTDSQGLVYRYPIDDEGEIEKKNVWAVSAGKLKKNKIVIPDTFNGKKVVEVDWDGFHGCKKITSITLGKNVKQIKGQAFLSCKNLSEVKFKGNSLKSIYSYAFEECNALKRIDLPKSLNWMSEGVFARSGLEEITIPNKVENIWDYTFGECKNLKKVKLNKKIKEIRSGSFENCISLKKIAIPKKVEIIRDEAFAGCTQLEKVNFKGEVREIEENAFRDTPFLEEAKKGEYCIINGLLIETYGEFTGNLVIDGNEGLNGVKIRGIGGTAFSNNKNLKKITIKNMNAIAGNAFGNCKAEECYIENVDKFSYYAFMDSSITIVTVKNIKELDECFNGLEAKEYYASDIGKIGYESIPRNVEKIEIDGIKKKSVIPSIRTQEKLKSAIIKGNISEIDAMRIAYCPALENLTIETPLTPKWTAIPMEDQWFEGSTSIKDIYIKAGGVDVSIAGVFSEDMILHVPAEQVEEYKKYVDCKVVAWE